MEKRTYHSREEGYNENSAGTYSSSGGGTGGGTGAGYSSSSYKKSDSSSYSHSGSGGGSGGGGGYSRNDTTSSGGYSRSDTTSSGGYSRNDTASSGGYSRNDTASTGGGYSRNDSSSGGYSRNDTASTGGGYSRNDSSSGGGGYSRNDSSSGGGGGGYSRSDSSYSRNGSSGYSRNDSTGSSYSRNDSYKSRGGGYSSRGRGASRFASGGYGSQNSDSWDCSSCKFSNYGSRTSCYKCRQPKDDSGDEPRRKWGMSDDSWKKPSWNNSSRDKPYSRDYGKSSSDGSWKNKEEGLIDWDDLKKTSAKFDAEKWAHLPELVKNLYVECPTISAMTPEEVSKFRESSNNMTVEAVDRKNTNPIPNPVMAFDQAFSAYPIIMQEIKRQGFTTPSPIQCQAWPILMKGYDMIGTAQTGTGKTLAFLLPALLHIVAQPTPRWERIGPTVLVLAPTRELAQQIEREVLKFEYENIRCVCVYGQGDRRSQIQKLNAMSEIVIATPGRLNDLLEQGVVNLNGVSYLVLDEADRMLDMGFEPQVRKIVMNIRPDRQTILTSATWPSEVRVLAGKLMKDPIHVVVGSLDLQAVDTITQQVIVCSIMEKEDKLMSFLKEMKPDDKAIVFVAQKVTVDDLSVKLYEAGFFVESMHGGRNQRDREYSLRQLKTGRSKILIATDVAARGIDIHDITHVLNYDCPKDMEEYVHRVGRTGRAGKAGAALTLMCRDDWKVAGKLIEILEKSNQSVPPELWNMKKRWERAQSERQDRYGGRNGHHYGGGGGGGGRSGWYTP